MSPDQLPSSSITNSERKSSSLQGGENAMGLQAKSHNTARAIFEMHRDAEDMINAKEENAGFSLLQDAQNLLFGTLTDIDDEKLRLQMGRVIYEELARLWGSLDSAAEVFKESEAPVTWEMIQGMILDDELPAATQRKTRRSRL